VLADRVHINGEKTEYRGRDVPLVDYPVRPEIKRTGFNSAIRRYSIAAGVTFNPYQARKSFTRWMEDARVPRARRVAYLGHSAADVQDAYELYEIDAYLREDAERMRALIGPQKLALAQ
jgi:integrase